LKLISQFINSTLELICLLLENDEFRSNAMAGKVAYTTPSVMTLMNTPYDSFNGNGLPNGV
jgi:hypothetical protein